MNLTLNLNKKCNGCICFLFRNDSKADDIKIIKYKIDIVAQNIQNFLFFLQPTRSLQIKYLM